MLFFGLEKILYSSILINEKFGKEFMFNERNSKKDETYYVYFYGKASHSEIKIDFKILL